MLKATWRRPGSPAWLAAALVLLLPTLAQAQLFPNRAIRRERPPASSEPPFNSIVRRDYFGYYPTCWSKFPAGWACPCPNPELPNPAASFAKIPFNKRRGSVGDDSERGADPDNPDAGAGDMPRSSDTETPNIPLPNGGRSPFNLDANPTPPGATPATDPFITPDPTAPKPAGPGSAPAPAGRPSGSTSSLEMPRLPSTSPSTTYESSLTPGSMVMMPDATLASSDTNDGRPDLGPLPINAAASSPATSTAGPSAFEPTAVGGPVPAQAPRRRGLLSGLFGGGATRRR